jgi:hypothetical protein
MQQQPPASHKQGHVKAWHGTAQHVREDASDPQVSAKPVVHAATGNSAAQHSTKQGMSQHNTAQHKTALEDVPGRQVSARPALHAAGNIQHSA